jgi:ubiquinone/menaquinone biosynthesis C-methylase UbiE
MTFNTPNREKHLASAKLRNFILEKSFQYGYSEYNRNLRSLLNWHRYEKIVEDVLTNSSQGSILDVGCGFGQITEMLHLKRTAVMGIDIGGETRENKVWKHLRAPFVLGDGCNLPVKSETFDVVVCCGVLEHAYDKRRFLKECYRVSKSNGLFLCYFLPNKTGLESLFSRITSTEHIFYDGSSIESLFNECGWKVFAAKREHIMPSFYVHSSLQKLANKLDQIIVMLDDMLGETPLRFFGTNWKVYAGKAS